METEQLGLFKPSGNPLEERLGKTFFDDLPKQPGVYKMFGPSGLLLYVGKAKNLRNRLFTYRRVKSGKGSRKTRRLVRMIYGIEYDICESEEAALLRENAIIRNRKPEFNHAKKSPETHYFLTLKPEKDQYIFRLAMQMPDDEELLGYTYGAFKGHHTMRMGSGALLRQLYLLEHEVHLPFDFPSSLMKNMTPLQYNLSYASDLLSSKDLQFKLHSYLTGKSLHFIEMLVEIITNRGLMGKYIGRMILKDCESLRRLYDYCLHRNFKLKEELDFKDSIIPQMKLDDYLIRYAFACK